VGARAGEGTRSEAAVFLVLACRAAASLLGRRHSLASGRSAAALGEPSVRRKKKRRGWGRMS
jgi:hypothetical protein